MVCIGEDVTYSNKTGKVEETIYHLVCPSKNTWRKIFRMGHTSAYYDSKGRSVYTIEEIQDM